MALCYAGSGLCQLYDELQSRLYTANWGTEKRSIDLSDDGRFFLECDESTCHRCDLDRASPNLLNEIGKAPTIDDKSDGDGEWV